MPQVTERIAIPTIMAVPTVLVSPPNVVEGLVIKAENDYQPPELPIAAQRRRSLPFLVVLPLCGLVAGIVGALVITPWLTASATVILTPQMHTLQTKATIVAAPNAHSEVYADLFPAEQESLSRTVPTTGIATQPATAAHGTITFWNALTAPQTIAAGTLLMSASGVPVLTQEAAYIPAGTGAANGSTTVRAQAENTGASGNIAAGDIQGPCCRAYVLAYNSAFIGGADTWTYHTPTTTDITTAQTQLTNQVNERMQAHLRSKRTAGEVMLTPACTTNGTSSAQPGVEADQVTVTEMQTCKTAAYQPSALEHAAMDHLSALAAHDLGSRSSCKGTCRAQLQMRL